MKAYTSNHTATNKELVNFIQKQRNEAVRMMWSSDNEYAVETAKKTIISCDRQLNNLIVTVK